MNLTYKKVQNVFKYLIALFPFWLYIVGVQLLGEVHPFSRFPMYSSFPTVAEYYYLADENDKPISTYRFIGVTNDELWDMMYAMQESRGIAWDNQEAKYTLALECLEEIKTKWPSHSGLKEIKWVWHEIYGEDIDNIEERKTVLATCRLN